VHAIGAVIGPIGEINADQLVAPAAVGLQDLRQRTLAFLMQVAPDVCDGKVPLRARGGQTRPDVIAEFLFAERETLELSAVPHDERLEDGGRQGLRRLVSVDERRRAAGDEKSQNPNPKTHTPTGSDRRARWSRTLELGIRDLGFGSSH
jgi:hypothetical protein